MSENRVSIVIPVYKVEKYLRRCLDSVAGQTYPAWEMILVDDGSPSRCGDICEAYAAQDGRIRVIHQQNGGLSAARNTGMKHCSGKYLLFVDSDDYLAPGALEFLVRRAEEGSYEIVMAGHYRVEPDGSTPDQAEHWEESTDCGRIRRDILCNRLPNFAWGKLYLRSLWDGVQFPRGRLVEDLYAVARVFYAAESACVCRCPLYYYSHENAGSIMNRPDLDNYIRIRYGRFLGWREHEKLAAQLEPDCVMVCAAEALRAGVRAFVLDTEQTALSGEDRVEIESYTRAHRNVPVSVGIRLLARGIARGDGEMLRLLGRVQRKIVQRQMQRRYEKLLKK